MADVTVEFGATDTGLEKTLKAVQDELTQLKGKVSSGELSMTELESTMKRIGQVESMEKRIKAIGDASSESSPKIKNLEDTIDSTGDKTKKVGDIFDGEFKKISAAFTVGNLAAEGFQKVISLVFEGARNVAQGFSDALDLGGRLSELSARTGEAAGTLLVLETAFKNSGLEASQVGQVINKLQNFMQDAANGGEKQAKVMSDLGISMADLAGKTPSEQMEVFAKKIAAIEDPTQRAATASEVFGEKLGGKLLPLLVGFSSNIDDAKAKVGSLEQVMNDNADTFDKFSESIEAVKGKMAAFAAGVLSETVPALQELGTSMEEVDAAKIGQEIGTILNPALSELATILKDVTSEYADYYNAVQDASMGNVDAANSSKDATGMLDLLKVMMVSITGPISDLISGTTDYTDAANAQQGAITGVTDAASEAAPVIDAIADSAKTAGTNIASAFSLNEEFRPQLDSIETGWKNVGENIGTSNSLLEGTEAAFGSIAEETEKQFIDLGDINDQVKKGKKLHEELLEITKKITDDDKDAAARAERKAEEQKKSNELKQKELAFQLELAEAQADGDSERVKFLQEQKKYAEDVQKALAAGFDKNEAALFATNMAIAAKNSANIKQYDKDGNPLFFKAAEMSAKLNENLKSATGFADTLAKIKEIKALDQAHNSAKGMRDELKAFDKLLGTTFSQKSEYDLVKLFNIKNVGPTSQDQIRAIVKYLDEFKDDLSKDPINTEKSQAKIKSLIGWLGGNPLKADLVVKYEKAQEQIAQLSDVPVTVDAKVDKKAFDNSIANLNTEIKNNFTGGSGGAGGNASAQGGSGGDGSDGGAGGKGGDATAPMTMGDVLSAIKGFVETIKEKVVTLETKLPQQVLA